MLLCTWTLALIPIHQPVDWTLKNRGWITIPSISVANNHCVLHSWFDPWLTIFSYGLPNMDNPWKNGRVQHLWSKLSFVHLLLLEGSSLWLLIFPFVPVVWVLVHHIGAILALASFLTSMLSLNLFLQHQETLSGFQLISDVSYVLV